LSVYAGRARVRAGALGAAATVIRWSGAPAVARRLAVRACAGIIVYHNPSHETVERHLGALCDHHAFVPLDVVVEALHSGRWTDIPPRSLVITIDDGYKENAQLDDVFAAFGVIPTVYLCSRIVGTDQPFWWTRTRHDVERLKRLPNAERLAVLRDEPPWVGGRQSLSLDEIRRLSGTWSFGAHTATHPILPRCTDEEARDEIVGSKREVEAMSGGRCLHFAYPNGAFGQREIAYVRNAGFKSARTTDAGWIRPDTDPMRLPIVPMPDNASANRAVSQIVMVSLAPRVFRRPDGLD
jgi:peptidoglycan/xylan/chitin deacetylase (PgdA/CDA1 family)